MYVCLTTKRIDALIDTAVQTISKYEVGITHGFRIVFLVMYCRNSFVYLLGNPQAGLLYSRFLLHFGRGPILLTV